MCIRDRPYGVEGEICVAGEGLAKGYLKRNELNEIKFIENPYIKGERIYRSGDSAIVTSKGNLYYKGRIDKQVKIRGYRIEIGEIETRILEHTYIRECVVLPRKEKDIDTYLVAYIVCDKNIDVVDLKDYLVSKLPAYMVPSYFVKLNSMPLNLSLIHI